MNKDKIVPTKNKEILSRIIMKFSSNASYEMLRGAYYSMRQLEANLTVVAKVEDGGHTKVIDILTGRALEDFLEEDEYLKFVFSFPQR